MRWHKRQTGDWRLITKFLFWPTCIGNECRWLERASIAQKSRESLLGPPYWGNEFWYDKAGQPFFVSQYHSRTLNRASMLAAGIDVNIVTINYERE